MMLEDLVVRTLSRGGNPDPTELVAAWGRVRVRPDLLRLVRTEGAALWLHARLREVGVPPGTGLLEALRTPAREDMALNLRVDAAARTALEALAAAGIPAVLLKGMARRAAGYPLAALRWSADVDLLVPEGEARRAWDHLAAHGFGAGDFCATPEDHHHLPPLVGPEGIPVELHTSTSRWVTPAQAWERMAGSAETREWQGLQVLISSPTELLWHAAAHAVEDGSPGYTLRRFLDAAAILDVETVDRGVLAQRSNSGELRDVDSGEPIPEIHFRHWLGLAAWFAGVGKSEHQWFARLLRWRRMVLASALPDRLRTSFMEEGWRLAVAKASGSEPRGLKAPGSRKSAGVRTLARASWVSIDAGLKLVRSRP